MLQANSTSTTMCLTTKDPTDFFGMEYSKERITASVERILKHRDIAHLTKEAYDFITTYCGSIAHYDIHGWRAAYADPRAFLDFFLFRNEYGTCLADLPVWMNLSQNAEIVAAIVDVCRRYRDEVFAELDEMQRQMFVELGKRLIKELFGD